MSRAAYLIGYTPEMYLKDYLNSDEYVIDKIISGERIVTWANSSWEDIALILNLHYAGKLDITDYWNVGDTRTVSLSAMSATGVSESHVAQDVELVLMSAEHYDLTSSQKTSLGTSKTKAAFVFGQKNMLANGTTREGGYMNNSTSNSVSWNNCARRTWCNSVYKAALPSNLQGLLKQVSIVSTSGTGSGATTSSDYCFLPAEKEIFGSNTRANSTAEMNLKQYTYYATSANRIKKAGASGNAGIWWERSTDKYNTNYFCYVNSSGSAKYTDATSTSGLAPCGCI